MSQRSRLWNATEEKQSEGLALKKRKLTLTPAQKDVKQLRDKYAAQFGMEVELKIYDYFIDNYAYRNKDPSGLYSRLCKYYLWFKQLPDPHTPCQDLQRCQYGQFCLFEHPTGDILPFEHGRSDNRQLSKKIHFFVTTQNQSVRDDRCFAGSHFVIAPHYSNTLLQQAFSIVTGQSQRHAVVLSKARKGYITEFDSLASKYSDIRFVFIDIHLDANNITNKRNKNVLRICFRNYKFCKLIYESKKPSNLVFVPVDVNKKVDIFDYFKDLFMNIPLLYIKTFKPMCIVYSFQNNNEEINPFLAWLAWSLLSLDIPILVTDPQINSTLNRDLLVSIVNGLKGNEPHRSAAVPVTLTIAQCGSVHYSDQRPKRQHPLSLSIAPSGSAHYSDYSELNILVYPNSKCQCWTESPLEILYRTWINNAYFKTLLQKKHKSNKVWTAIYEHFIAREKYFNIFKLELFLRIAKERIVQCIIEELHGTIKPDKLNFVSDFLNALKSQNGQDLFGIKQQITQTCLFDGIPKDRTKYITEWNITSNFVNGNFNVSADKFTKIIKDRMLNTVKKLKCTKHCDMLEPCSTRTTVTDLNAILVFIQDMRAVKPIRVQYPKELLVNGKIYKLCGIVLYEKEHFTGIVQTDNEHVLQFDSIGHGTLNKKYDILRFPQKDQLIQIHPNTAHIFYFLS